MKKILLSLLALCAVSSLWAAKFQSGLLYYNTLAGDSTVEVTYRDYVHNYSDLTAVTIPETVTYSGKTYTVVAIGKQAFADEPEGDNVPDYYDNTSLKLINIPKTVQTIDSYAFYKCTALTTVNFLGDGLTLIGSYAFYGTDKLLTFDFPETLKTIGSYAFCRSSSSGSTTGLSGALVIPNTVTSIGYCAFGGLKSLTSVIVGNAVTAIDDCTFQNCSGLTSVTLGNSVATIGSSAFASCTSLPSITLPKSVKTINNSAFASCSKLTTVYLKSTTPPVFTNTNILPSSAKTFYVPCGAADTYFLSDWVTFTTDFKEECDKQYTIYVNQDCTSSVVEQ